MKNPKPKTTPHLMTMEEWAEFATGNKKGLKIHDEKTLKEIMEDVKYPSGRYVINIDISDAHMDALRVIMSEEWPYADDRNLSPVFEAMIEEYLARENGRLGSIVDGKYVVQK